MSHFKPAPDRFGPRATRALAAPLPAATGAEFDQ